MNQVTDATKPSNPYQATTIADLITPNQLHWLTVAAESVNADKDEIAIALFNCSVFSLSRTAAAELEQHCARLKMNEHQRHEHDCALCGGDTFACKQSLCNASLAIATTARPICSARSWTLRRRRLMAAKDLPFSRAASAPHKWALTRTSNTEDTLQSLRPL